VILLSQEEYGNFLRYEDYSHRLTGSGNDVLVSIPAFLFGVASGENYGA
jgi:hypothetical protein